VKDRILRAVRRSPALYRLGQGARIWGLAAADAFDAMTTRRRGLVPPRRYRLVGAGDFADVGRRYVDHVVELAGLGKDDDVLDIGCGSGRMAIPLLDFLGPDGSYRGFDIVPEWIRWCTDNVGARNPRFQFTVADIRNRKYNPSGAVEASAYRFPYDSDSFAVAFATSVFTHLMPADVENYIAETARVLEPGGRLLATFFLFGDRSRAGLRAGSAAIDFGHRLDGCYVTDPALPELAVAYDEEDVRKLHREHGLELVEPIHYGSWSGLAGARDYQDIVVARRPG
jgi:ubiquinone/menaquinone biosynthesis C-methylase UbiE